MGNLLEVGGILGIILIIIFLIFIPVIATIILGCYIASTVLGLTGIVWWCFLIIFYLIIMGIIGALSRLA